MKQRTHSAFTLIELIVVMGIIAVLAAIVIIAVNPARQLAQARNSTRVNDVTNIQKALNQYRTANIGSLPAGVATVPKSICRGPSGCAAGTVDLSTLVPTYLTDLPKDPSGGTNADTGYTVYATTEGRIVVSASNAELVKSITTDQAAFNPMQIPSLSLWLDATSFTGVANGAVIGATNVWEDSSSNGSIVSQATAANQPTYRTNVISGKPVVRFDGSDFLTVTGDSSFSERTYVFVMKGGPVATNGIFNHGNYATGAFHINYSLNRPLLYLASSNFRYWAATTTPTDNAAHLYEVYVKGGAQSDIALSELYIDGELQSVTSTPQTSVPGAWGNLLLGYGFTGDMAEFMAIKRSLTDQQRANLHNYAKQKWGTP